MNYLDTLLKKSDQIADITKENFDVDLVEKYHSAYYLWIQNAPIPSRPIFERAWMEASILAETSIFLSVHGFYEQACATLRMELDGFITRLYWDIKDKNMELSGASISERQAIGYWNWESGKSKKYPLNEDIWGGFKKEKTINEFVTKYNLRNDIENHNRELHKYIHGRPTNRHIEGNTRSSSINIKFVEKEFDEWFELFGKTYDLISIISILLYPEYLIKPSVKDFIFLESKVINQINNIVNS